MNFLRTKRANSHQQIGDDRPAKRISTPAGQRLSIILDAKRGKSPSSSAQITKTTESTFCNDPSHQHVGPVQHGPSTPRKANFISVLTGGRLNTPRESSEDNVHNGSNVSVSVWSARDEEKFGHIRQKRRRVCAWGWKRMALIAAIIIALIVALGVGLALGLKRKDTTSSPTATTGASTPAGSNTKPSATTETESPSASSTSTLTPSAVPSNFPVGTYSLVLFLDTTTTTCTANTDTWTCSPYTDYYSDPQKALTILNWSISGSKGAYKISSGGLDATFETTFQNENLELLDSGKDTERYRFQIMRSKTVNATTSIGDEKGDFECDYDYTNINGYLYTKMQRTYPDETVAISGAGDNVWPYAARVEQSVAGGKGVPACKSSSGDKASLESQSANTLCACLYKNWTPKVE